MMDTAAAYVIIDKIINHGWRPDLKVILVMVGWPLAVGIVCVLLIPIISCFNKKL